MLEILDYAQYLGIDPIKEKDFLWIARDGLKTPLPPAWKPCKSSNGKVYYFNFETGESIWDHPCDIQCKELYEQEKKKRKDKNSSVKKKTKTVIKSSSKFAEEIKVFSCDIINRNLIKI